MEDEHRGYEGQCLLIFKLWEGCRDHHIYSLVVEPFTTLPQLFHLR